MQFAFVTIANDLPLSPVMILSVCDVSVDNADVLFHIASPF